MSKRTVTILGVIAILAITFGYMYLGGLNSIEYTIENVDDYNLVGVPYQGKGDSSAVEDAFIEARELVASKELDGVLTIINYKDTTLADEELKMFIGVRLNSGTSKFPSHFQRLTIPAKRAVRATIEAHNAVMPKPQTIEANLIEKAQEGSFELQRLTIEQYISERKLIIEMPAR